MKENVIKKIRQFGNVGYIATIFARIFLVMGIVACVASMGILALLPKELLYMDMSGKVKLTVDTEAAKHMTPISWFKVVKVGDLEYALEDLEDWLQEENVDTRIHVNGASYAIDSVTADEGKLVVDASANGIRFGIHSLVWLPLIGIVGIIFALVVVTFAGGLCKAFRDCDSPFSDNVITKMQNFAYSMIPLAFFRAVNYSLMYGMVTGTFQFQTGIDITPIFAMLVIFAVAYIFKYGAMLQKESDETL